MHQKKINLLLETLLMPVTKNDYPDGNYFYRYLKTTVKEEKKYNINEIRNTIISHINTRAKINSLDELDLIICKYYKRLIGYNDKSNNSGEEGRFKQHFPIFFNIIKTFISFNEGRICFKYWDDLEPTYKDDFNFYECEESEYFEFNEVLPYKEYNKLLIWNAMRHKVSSDFFFILFLVYSGLNDIRYLSNYSNHLYLQDNQLNKILKKGISDTHLHFSASGDFLTCWELLMSNMIATKEIDISRIVGSFNKIFDIDIIDIDARVSKASLIRLLQCIYFYKGEDVKEGNDFNKFLNDTQVKSCKNYEELFEFLDEINSIPDKNSSESIKKYGFSTILDRIYELFDLYNELKNDNCIGKYNKFDDIYMMLATSVVDVSGEALYLMKAINYIKNYEDKQFERLFWDYIILKNEFYRMMVEDSQIKGLDYFKVIFKNSTNKEFDINAGSRYRRLLNFQFQDENIVKFEIRISPNQRSDMLKNLRMILKEYNNIIEKKEYTNIPYIGIVYHLIKQKDSFDLDVDKEACLQKLVSSSGENSNFGYYQKLRQKYIEEIKDIIQIRSQYKNLSKFIVGLDAASGENDCEPWVFAPVYRFARKESSNRLCEHLGTEQGLSFTFHVGEDFRHLLTGIRRIDEVVSHFGYRAGDRIGHGIALGVDVNKYQSANPTVIIPIIEMLENYLWVWNEYLDADVTTDIDIKYIESKIIEMSKKIFCKDSRRTNYIGLDPYNLYSAYQKKFDDNYEYYHDIVLQSESSNSCECHLFNNDTMVWDESKILCAYNCKRFLSKMNTVINVEITDKDVAIMNFSRDLVLEKISKRGIVIETNPSSNSVIGDIDSINSHHILKLNTGYDLFNKNLKSSVIATINTDDPSVFNTNLSSEYAYIFYSLMNRGYPKEEILKWIDNIREHGVTSSFIRDRDNETYLEELNELIEDLKKEK